MCLEWLEISHLSAITNPGTLTHTETPATSFPSRLFLSSALSILTTLDQDPVTDPPKRDWLQERGEFCLPSRSPSLSFLGFLPPSSLSLSARLSLSLLFISRSPLFSLPCLYFLLCRVKSENTELRVLHPQIPACSLSGWILKAKGGTKVQIRFFWIVLLLIQTCPCYLSLSQLSRFGLRGRVAVSVCAYDYVCLGGMEATAGHMKMHTVGVRLGRIA